MIQTATDAARPLHTLAKLPQTGEEVRQAPTIAVNGAIDVADARDIYLALDASDVVSAFREGSDLILVDGDGATIRLKAFFEPGAERRLYLEGDDNRNVLLDTQAVQSDGPLTLTFVPQVQLSPFVTLTENEIDGVGIGALGAGGLASLAAAGLAGMAGGGGGGGGGKPGDGGSSPPADNTPPQAPTNLAFDATGARLSGAGEAGTTVIVRNSAGAQIGTGVVGADGTFVITLSPALINNEQVNVTLADPTGNVSNPGTATAPDLTAPSAPTEVDLSDNGGAVTGLGEPGATVTVRGPGGAILGTATVGATGAFTVSLAPPLTNGETVSVTQADGAGNVSGPATATAADSTAPGVPGNLDVADNGGSVTGNGEPGSTVTVRGPGGGVIGTGTVGVDGTFTVPLTPALTNGQTITATLTDAAGNVSGPATTTATDSTAPGAPTNLDVADNGGSVTGNGEPGSTVTVRGPGGGVIGTGTVSADGTFTVPLTPALTNGQTVAVTLTDATGNVSGPGTTTAPDSTAPGVPTNLDVADNGGLITGNGEPGSTVTVRGPGGGVIGTGTVGANGTFTVPLLPALTNGETVTATQRDAAGNVSGPATATATDSTAPVAPTNLDVADNGGSVTGNGEPGSIVTVRGPGGGVIGTGTAGADGAFTVAVSPALTNGQTITATLTDSAGNVSGPATATASDGTAPAAPANLDVSDNGASLTGNGEPGATVTVRGPGGGVIGTGTVGANGAFTVPLTPPLTNGETVRATLSDPAGNVSGPATAQAPDITAPSAPTNLDVSDDGAAVTGNGEPGAALTVRGPGGGVIGTGTVSADGTFSVSLTPALINRETVTATQSDVAGNVSGPATAVAPDLMTPGGPNGTDAPVLQIAEASGGVNAAEIADGVQTRVALTAGAQVGDRVVVTVASAGTSQVVQGIVTAADLAAGAVSITLPRAGFVDGNYSATAVILDAEGRTSATSASVGLLVDTATAAPVVTSANGQGLSGTAEAGATLTFRDAAGAVVATATAAADGRWTLAASQVSGQIDGLRGTITAVDAAGNSANGAFGPVDGATPVPVIAAQNGAVIAGSAEPGATLTLLNAAGTPVLGADGQPVRVVVGADGQWGIPASAVPGGLDGFTGSAAVVDAAGNTANASVGPIDGSVSLSLEIQTIAGDNIVNIAEAGSAAVIVTGRAVGDFSIGEVVTVTLSNGAVATAVIGAGGAWSASFAGSDLAASTGATARTTTTDDAGNTVTVSDGLTYAVDLTPPTAPIVQVANGQGLSGTAEAGAALILRDGAGTTIAQTSVGADGRWTVPATSVPGGLNGFTGSVQVADPAGNTATSSVGPVDGVTVIPTLTTANGAGLTGTAEAGATVTLVNGAGQPVAGGNGAPVTATVGANGVWNIPGGSVPGGLDGFTGGVVARDPAGNTGSATVGPVDGLTQAPVIIAANGSGLTGTAEAGATIVLTSNGSPVLGSDGQPVRTTAGSNGGWSFPATAVPGGLDGFTGSVQATDPVGNTASSPVGPIDGDISVSVVVDPVTTDNILNGAEAAQAGVTVSGRLVGEYRVGDIVQVTLTGGATQSATVGAAGVWTTNFSGAQLAAAGSLTATVTATDTSGNTVTVSDSQAFGVDLSTTTPVIQTANGAGVSGVAEAGAAIVLRDGQGTTVGTATAGTDGRWTIAAANISATLNGFNGSVVATDAAGNAATAPVGPVDASIAVQLTIASVTADNVINLVESGSAGIAVGGVVTGEFSAGDTVRVTLSGGASLTTTVAANGAWSVNVPGATLAASTSLTASITSTDAAGNTTTITTTQTYGVDLIAPTAPVLTQANAGGVAGSGEAGSVVQLLDGSGTPIIGASGQALTATVGQDGRWSLPASVFSGGVTPSGLSGQLVAVDTAGNVSALTPLPPIDATPPSGATTSVTIGLIAGDDVVNQAEASGSITIGGQVTGEFRVGDVVTVTTAGGIFTTTVGTGGLYSVSAPGVALSGGTIQVAVAASDAAGNVGTVTATRGYTVDTDSPGGPTGGSAPVLSIVAAADGLISPSEIGAGVSATIALTPTTREGDTLTLTLTGSGAPQTVAVVLTTQQIASGSAVVPIGALLANGAATVTAMIRDSAGNSSAPSATLSFNVDLVPIGLGATTATVSEANLGGVVTGALPVTGATGAVTYALQAPQGALTSLGQTVTWAIDGAGVLIGSAGGREVLRASIGADGQYRIVLSGAIDHSAQGVDSIETRIGVSVTDATGTTTGVIAVGIVDGVPQIANTTLAPTQPGVYVGDLVEFGADGGRLTSVTIDGRTFVYNPATDTVTLSGATTTLVAHSIDDGLLSVTTVRGETVTVDFDTGEYRVVVTGVDSAPTAPTAPSVALGGGQGLLGLIDADVLGLIQLDEQQFFSVSDLNNDTSEVTVRYEALLALGFKSFNFSTTLATELGLTVTPSGSLVLPAFSQLVIRAADGGAIDNLRLNEFLGSITIAGGLSALLDLSVDQSLSIQARDLAGNVTLDRESNLADLGVAAGLLGNALPTQTIVGGTGADVRTASDVGSGAALDNRMYGLAGDDVLNGGLGNDILRGGSGADSLNGGAGNDILIGGTGADTLTGGTGVDVFRWERGDQGTVGAPTTDTVTDFNVASALLGGDVLDLSSLLIGEGRIVSNPGNLSNFIHFELSGGSTRVLISTSGGFVGGHGSPTSGAPDQIIVLSNVDLVTGFGSDQAILADLLTRGKLVVDTLTLDGSTAPNILTLTGSAIDGDGDLGTASVTLNSANVVPAAPQASNSAPAVAAQAQSVLGLIGLGALGLNLNSQDLLVADVDNNLNRVELAYTPVVALNLTPLAFAYANGLAAQYGYSVQVTQSQGLVGVVAPTARIVITALDGGVLDNVEINRFLESVHLTDTGGGLLSSTLLSANVLSALTLTATDAQGAGSSAVLGQVLNVNLLNSLDGPDAAASSAFSAALDIGPERTSPLEPTPKGQPEPESKPEEPCIFPPLTAYSVDATGAEVISMPGAPDHSHAGAGMTLSLTELIADFTEDGWSDADFDTLSDPPRPAEEVLAQWTPLTIPQDEGAYAS